MDYRLGGLRLSLECQERRLLHRIEPVWRELFHESGAAATTSPLVARLCFGGGTPPPKPAVAQLVWQGGSLSSWRAANDYYLACGASALAIDTARGLGEGYLAPDFWRQPLVYQREFFLLAVLILLRWRDGYSLHANGVAWDEAGAIIVGSSGSGKTTLTLGLVQAGGRCLGDDALLLRPKKEGGIEAHALRRGFACTTQTAAHFPALAPALATAPALSEHKKLLALETHWPERFTPRCTPRLVVFPCVAGAARSRLTPLNPAQTLCALLEHSTGILVDATVAHRQLAVLGQLARQARGYRLQAGHDVYAEPDRVADLLRTALREG